MSDTFAKIEYSDGSSEYWDFGGDEEGLKSMEFFRAKLRDLSNSLMLVPVDESLPCAECGKPFEEGQEWMATIRFPGRSIHKRCPDE